MTVVSADLLARFCVAAAARLEALEPGSEALAAYRQIATKHGRVGVRSPYLTLARILSAGLEAVLEDRDARHRAEAPELLLLLAGFARGFSSTDRFVLSDFERETFRRIAGILANTAGRPDLDPGPTPPQGAPTDG